MNIFLNILWLIFGGLATAIEYLISSIALMITIIGIPFGLQTIKLGVMCLMPFGKKVVRIEQNVGCLSTLMNVIWFFVGGIWICLTHFALGVLLCITVIGIPFGRQHFKMASLALTPFGRDIIYED